MSVNGVAEKSQQRDEGARAGAGSRSGATAGLLAAGSPWRLRAGEDIADLRHSPLTVLVSQAPLRLPRQASVVEAEKALHAAGRGAAVLDGDPVSVVVVNDLRRRLLGGDVAPHTPVRAAARGLPAIAGDMPVGRALSWMAGHRSGLVGVRRNDELVGLVGFEDLAQRQAGVDLDLLNHVAAPERRALLQRYGRALGAAVDTLYSCGLDPVRIAAILAGLSDALSVRLLRQAERDLGGPPCPYSWLALGSQGRSEPALLSDQDNALVYRDESTENAAWFAALAGQVVDGLEAAGYPRCPGGFMATNWCRSLSEWQHVVRNWVHNPESQAVLETNLFLDFRSLHGGLSVAPLDDLLQSGANREVFLAQIARSATKFRPPLGLFGRLKARNGTIDVKHGGITGIVLIARLYGLAAHSSARSTLDRLAAASGTTLSAQSAVALGDGLHFLSGLRLREQIRRQRLGEAPGNLVPLEQLSDAERRRLRNGLRMVSVVQRATALKYHVNA